MRCSILLQKLLNRILPACFFLSSAAAVVGIAGGLNSLFGGSKAPSPTSYIYTNPAQQAQAANEYMSLLGMLYGTSGTVPNFANLVKPSIMGGLEGGLATDTRSLATLAPMLQQSYGNIANADAIWANLLGNQGATNMSALTQGGMGTYLNALDPQAALHDRLQQQIVDASRAGQSARGIAIGGVGQGMEDQAVRDFNIDWQNQLLGRQVQGLTAMERALSTASQTGQNNFGAASTLLGQVPGAQIGGATSFMQPSLQNLAFLNNLIPGYGNLFNATQVSPFLQGQNQILPFLSGGQGAGANAMQGAFTGYGINQGNVAGGTEALLTGLNKASSAPIGQWLNSMWSQPGGGAPSDVSYSNMG